MLIMVANMVTRGGKTRVGNFGHRIIIILLDNYAYL